MFLEHLQMKRNFFCVTYRLLLDLFIAFCYFYHSTLFLGENLVVMTNNAKTLFMTAVLLNVIEIFLVVWECWVEVTGGSHVGTGCCEARDAMTLSLTGVGWATGSLCVEVCELNLTVLIWIFMSNKDPINVNNIETRYTTLLFSWHGRHNFLSIDIGF